MAIDNAAPIEYAIANLFDPQSNEISVPTRPTTIPTDRYDKNSFMKSKMHRSLFTPFFFAFLLNNENKNILFQIYRPFINSRFN